MSYQNNILKAVSVLRKGGLVAIPTETVYGLAADARNPEALRKIFLAKGRPIDHPLIVHLAEPAELSLWASNISDTAKRLAQAFWPGPLTLILQKASGISDLVTGRQDTIGIRIPHHPVALALLNAFGSGVAAPSANRFGRISPTTADAVREELGDAVDFVLEGGVCEVGLESTIIDVTDETPVILRPGMISAEEIERVIDRAVSHSKNKAPRVSGSLVSHYAPMTPTHLVESAAISDFLNEIELPAVVMGFEKTFSLSSVDFVQMPHDAKTYAHELYQVLRQLDKKHYCHIVIEAVPKEVEWDAIRDRVEKASR
jgi:L-threonylcarbamoyladenylate synthase